MKLLAVVSYVLHGLRSTRPGSPDRDVLRRPAAVRRRVYREAVGRLTVRRPVVRRAAGRPATRRPDALAVEEPMEIRVDGRRARGHDAHPRARRRAGPRVPAHRGRDHRGGPARVRALLRLGRRHRRRTRTTSWTSRSPRASPRRTPASSGTSTPRRRAASAARRAWTPSDCAAGSRPEGDTARVDAATLYGLPDALRAAQRVFDSTGGLHARGPVHRRRRPARGPRGRRAAQRRRQGARLGAAERAPPAGGLRADGLGRARRSSSCRRR